MSVAKRPVFSGYPPEEYPEVNEVSFPDELVVAYAVCGKSCGTREFIVDGQTQVCQRCGRLMFRTELRSYRLVRQDSDR